jgi:hypothetical protein
MDYDKLLRFACDLYFFWLVHPRDIFELQIVVTELFWISFGTTEARKVIVRPHVRVK